MRRGCPEPARSRGEGMGGKVSAERERPTDARVGPGRCVSDSFSRSVARRLTATMFVSLLAAGCVPLADRHEFFAGTRTVAAKIDAQTISMLRRTQALQMTRRACVELEAVGFGDGPGLSGAADNGVPTPPCTAVNTSPSAWHGATADGFRKWVEDKVPKLPEPGITAVIAGDS